MSQGIDDDGPIMKDRRSLNSDLLFAAEKLGAHLFDQTEFITRHGRHKVLDAGGNDIYHYAPEFVIEVGEELLRQVAIAAAANGRGFAARAPALAASTAADGSVRESAMENQLDTFAAELNRDMSAFHAPRVAKMGVNESGLYAHYIYLMERNAIVGPGAVELARFILAELPAFKRYVILRAGLGELGFLLARAGKTVVMADIFPQRVAATQAFASHLMDKGKAPAGSITVHEGLFPPGELDAVDTLGIAAHFLNVGDDTGTTRALRRLSNLVIEERAFLTLRETPEARRQGVELVIGAGFCERHESHLSEWMWLERIDPAVHAPVTQTQAGQSHLAHAPVTQPVVVATAALRAPAAQIHTAQTPASQQSPAKSPITLAKRSVPYKDIRDPR